MDRVKGVPEWAESYSLTKKSNSFEVEFFVSPSVGRPIKELVAVLAPRPDVDAVIETMRATQFPGRDKPRNKYDREILPGIFVDVYDVLRAFKVTSGAIAHAVKKLLAPGQRGVKTERDDVAEARDSLNREIQQIDEWA
jgi:hypothetical protein